MANTIFAGIPLEGSGSRQLDADLYGADQQGVDGENIASTGNLNIGNIIQYDEHAQRYLSGGIMADAEKLSGLQPLNRYPITSTYSPASSSVATSPADTTQAAPAGAVSNAYPAATSPARSEHALASESTSANGQGGSAPAATGGTPYASSGSQSYSQSSAYAQSSSNGEGNTYNTYNYYTSNTTNISNNTSNTTYNNGHNNYLIGNILTINENGGNGGNGGHGGDIFQIINHITTSITNIANSTTSTVINNTTGGDSLLSILNNTLNQTINILNHTGGNEGGSGGAGGSIVIAPVINVLDNSLNQIVNIIGGGNQGDCIANITGQLGDTLTNITQILSASGETIVSDITGTIQSALISINQVIGNDAVHDVTLAVSGIVNVALGDITQIIQQQAGGDIFAQVLQTANTGLSQIGNAIGDLGGQTASLDILATATGQAIADISHSLNTQILTGDVLSHIVQANGDILHDVTAGIQDIGQNNSLINLGADISHDTLSLAGSVINAPVDIANGNHILDGGLLNGAALNVLNGNSLDVAGSLINAPVNAALGNVTNDLNVLDSNNIDTAIHLTGPVTTIATDIAADASHILTADSHISAPVSAAVGSVVQALDGNGITGIIDNPSLTVDTISTHVENTVGQLDALAPASGIVVDSLQNASDHAVVPAVDGALCDTQALTGGLINQAENTASQLEPAASHVVSSLESTLHSAGGNFAADIGGALDHAGGELNTATGAVSSGLDSLPHGLEAQASINIPDAIHTVTMAAQDISVPLPSPASLPISNVSAPVSELASASHDVINSVLDNASHAALPAAPVDGGVLFSAVNNATHGNGSDAGGQHAPADMHVGHLLHGLLGLH